MSKNDYSEKKIIMQLTERMFQHRKTLGLTQGEVAELLGKTEKTYQRCESAGSGLSNFLDIQKVFKVLQFSTTEVIDLLKLPPLTLKEVEEHYQDEETLKSIRENSICSFLRQTCGKLESTTIEKMLCILLKEYLKRKRYTFDD